jgi:glycosyltransferase involved in cell wall biosynthesis
MESIISPVGVIVPVHDFGPYLAEALDAVLAEEPAAVVVVDDAAPAPIVLHPDHAPRCMLVRRERPGGPAAARASGLAALGDAGLVALCDARDAWAPGSLAPRMAALEADEEAVGCFGRALSIGPDGRATGERWMEPPAGRVAADAWLHGPNPVPASSVAVRRDTLERAGGFAGAKDRDLWLRLAALGPWLCVPEAFVRCRGA